MKNINLLDKYQLTDFSIHGASRATDSLFGK